MRSQGLSLLGLRAEALRLHVSAGRFGRAPLRLREHLQVRGGLARNPLLPGFDGFTVMLEAEVGDHGSGQ